MAVVSAFVIMTLLLAAGEGLSRRHSGGKVGISLNDDRKDAFECTYTAFVVVREEQTSTPLQFDTPVLKYRADGSLDYQESLYFFLSSYRVQRLLRRKGAHEAF
jgi:hypothetical protein